MTWTPEQYWEYVGGLAGDFERDQMRVMMAERGLSITAPPQCAREPVAWFCFVPSPHGEAEPLRIRAWTTDEARATSLGEVIGRAFTPLYASPVSRPDGGGTSEDRPYCDPTEQAKAFYLAMYENKGANWDANENQDVWVKLARDYERRRREAVSLSRPVRNDPIENERERCIAICESWIGAWQKENPTVISARTWAIGAVEDIAELIRKGYDPGASALARPNSEAPNG